MHLFYELTIYHMSVAVLTSALTVVLVQLLKWHAPRAPFFLTVVGHVAFVLMFMCMWVSDPSWLFPKADNGDWACACVHN